MRRFIHSGTNKRKLPSEGENRVEYIKKEKNKNEESKKINCRFKKWTEDEELKLQEYIKENKSFTEISVLLERTELAITIRYADICLFKFLNYVNNTSLNKNIEQRDFFFMHSIYSLGKKKEMTEKFKTFFQTNFTETDKLKLLREKLIEFDEEKGLQMYYMITEKCSNEKKKKKISEIEQNFVNIKSEKINIEPNTNTTNPNKDIPKCENQNHDTYIDIDDDDENDNLNHSEEHENMNVSTDEEYETKLKEIENRYKTHRDRSGFPYTLIELNDIKFLLANNVEKKFIANLTKRYIYAIERKIRKKIFYDILHKYRYETIMNTYKVSIDEIYDILLEFLTDPTRRLGKNETNKIVLFKKNKRYIEFKTQQNSETQKKIESFMDYITKLNLQKSIASIVREHANESWDTLALMSILEISCEKDEIFTNIANKYQIEKDAYIDVVHNFLIKPNYAEECRLKYIKMYYTTNLDNFIKKELLDGVTVYDIAEKLGKDFGEIKKRIMKFYEEDIFKEVNGLRFRDVL
jgi:hypothetical protein